MDDFDLVLGIELSISMLVQVGLGCDVSAFSYANLPRLNMFKIYYKRDIVVESPTKPYCTLCKLSISLPLTIFNACDTYQFYNVFNDFLSLSCFIKQFSQEGEGRLHHTISLFATFEFYTVDLLTEQNKCRTIMYEKLRL
uniref:Uncharacterized protein n=1 Tax=Cucumis melo TaxID=3656 RepID=A0A9I9EAC5_CUCME